MTIPTPREPWDDERLGAAFRVRAAGTTTRADLAWVTLAAVRAKSTSTQWLRLLVPAAVVVLAVGAITGWMSLRDDQRGRADATASPIPSNGEAMGLPIVSVGDAIKIRDGGISDQEIAVRGWFPPVPPIRCPPPSGAATSPIQPQCPDGFTWLTQENEAATTSGPTWLSSRGPKGPAISPDLDGLDPAWMSALPRDGPWLGPEVVFVGHFDDRRSSACAPAVRQACRDQFVVDRVDSVNDESLALSVVDHVEGDQASTIDEVRAVVENAAPQSPVLSAGVVDGSAGIGSIEPSLRTGVDGFIDKGAIWVVRVLEGDRSVTYLVVDGTRDVFKMDPEGAPIPVAATASPSASTTVLGIPVISVPELIAIRIGGPHPSPEEVAVRGWMIRSNVVYDCLRDPRPHPLVPWCQTPTFLMEQPERPTELTTSGPSVVPIIGPDATIEVGAGNVPVEVIAIGHLGDHRWSTCLLSQQDTCRREFVIDRVLAVGASATEVPEPWRIPDPEPGADAVDPTAAIRRLRTMVDITTVVSVGYVDRQALPAIEPAVNDSGDVYTPTRPTSVWVVRALVDAGPTPDVVRTFILSDNADGSNQAAWEANEQGVLPIPEPGGYVWPPHGATVIQLTSPVGAGRPPAQVAVDDRSGWMTSVREVRAGDPATNNDFSRGRLYLDSAGRYRLQRIGSICDSNITATIAEAARRIDIYGGERAGCDAMGIGRELVLTFSKPVDAAATEVFYDVTILPED